MPSGPINLSNPVNRNAAINEGLTSWYCTLPGRNRGAVLRDLMSANPLAVGAGQVWEALSPCGLNGSMRVTGGQVTSPYSPSTGTFTLSMQVAPYTLNDGSARNVLAFGSSDGYFYVHGQYNLIIWQPLGGGNPQLFIGWYAGTFTTISMTVVGTSAWVYQNGTPCTNNNSGAHNPQSVTSCSGVPLRLFGTNSTATNNYNAFWNDLRIYDGVAWSDSQHRLLASEIAAGYPNAFNRVGPSIFLMGSAVSPSAGSAAGSATATAVGSALFPSVGSAVGLASVSGIGSILFASAGSSTGLATLSGVGASIATSTASATGVATASAVGTSTSSGTGVATATGLATVSGIGASLFSSVATASGIGTTTGIGSAIANGIGSAIALASANAVSPTSSTSTFREALVAALLGSSALSAIVGTKVYPLKVPEDGGTVPAVLWHVEDLHTLYTLDGVANKAMAAVSLGVGSTDFAECQSMAKAIRDLIDGNQGVFSGLTIWEIVKLGEKDLYEPAADNSDQGTFWSVLPYHFHYRESLPTR